MAPNQSALITGNAPLHCIDSLTVTNVKGKAVPAEWVLP